MEFELTIREDMTVTEIAAGLILVAHLSWLAAAVVLIMAALVIGRIMGAPRLAY